MTHARRISTEKYSFGVKITYFMTTLCAVGKVELAISSTYSYIQDCVLSKKGGIRKKNGVVCNNDPFQTEEDLVWWHLMR